MTITIPAVTSALNKLHPRSFSYISQKLLTEDLKRKFHQTQKNDEKTYKRPSKSQVIEKCKLKPRGGTVWHLLGWLNEGHGNSQTTQ